jgi:DNA invertase Pin-like site-specific DNA recombinase
MEHKKSKKRAVIYARVSTLLGQDPANQTGPCTEFTRARSFELTDKYIDIGISGAKERRPELNRLVKDAQKRKFDILIVSGIDRIARDVRHLLNLITELEHYGISIISLRESIDFTTPMGKATLAILGAIAGLERELTRERIRTALAAKKLAAQQTGSDWKCGRPTKINKSLEMQILELKNRGLSIRAIAKELKIGKTSVHRVISSMSHKGG